MPTHNLPPDAFQTYTAGQPIPASLFAEAIKELPLDTVYAKAAELQNSISHLLSSNIQMKPFADDGDEVCREAIAENDLVIARHEERIGLCRSEIEARGLPWTGHIESNGESDKVNGDTNGERSGRLTDEELRQRLEAQLDDNEEDGVHL